MYGFNLFEKEGKKITNPIISQTKCKMLPNCLGLIFTKFYNPSRNVAKAFLKLTIESHILLKVILTLLCPHTTAIF